MSDETKTIRFVAPEPGPDADAVLATSNLRLARALDALGGSGTYEVTIRRVPKRRQYVFTETGEKGRPKTGQGFISSDVFGVATEDWNPVGPVVRLFRLEEREVDA